MKERLPQIVLSLLFALPLGCGKNPAIVHGKITYKSKPITTGEIHFFGDGNVSRSAAIGSDGTYEVYDCPLGLVTVTIEAREPKDVPKGGDSHSVTISEEAPPPLLFVSQVPSKYNSPDTSDIKLHVSSGRQRIDVILD